MCFEVGAMLRRDFISFLAGALVASSRVAIAQTPSKVYRVGTVFPSAPLDEKSPLGAVLLKKLEQHGYTLGKNLAFEARGAGGQVSKLGEIVNGMKANGVDVIVAAGFPTTLACKVANVPTVVFFGVGDPVATRLIDSLARPGGNITGISDNAAALATKRLELIKQAVPKVRRVAMLWNRNDLGMSMRYDASADAARSLGVTVQPFGVREPDDFAGYSKPWIATHRMPSSWSRTRSRPSIASAYSTTPARTIFQPSTNTISPMCMTAA
jgi:putative ABC transport system substrate-binding protein